MELPFDSFLASVAGGHTVQHCFHHCANVAPMLPTTLSGMATRGCAHISYNVTRNIATCVPAFIGAKQESPIMAPGAKTKFWRARPHDAGAKTLPSR